MYSISQALTKATTSRTGSIKLARHFFIVGGQRCGTTYLARLLDEHPDIEMAKPISPEPKFFLQENLTGQEHSLYHEKFFADSTSWRGEKATSYIESKDAARRIAAAFPNAVIIAVVRDPIDRAISNYRFSRRHGFESLSLEQALTVEAQERSYQKHLVSASPFSYLKRGHYVEFLENYRDFFPLEQMKIITFETLMSNDGIAQIYSYLGVENFDAPSLGKVINEGFGAKPGHPSSELEAFLRSHFLKSNRRLASMFSLEIHGWRSMR